MEWGIGSVQRRASVVECARKPSLGMLWRVAEYFAACEAAPMGYARGCDRGYSGNREHGQMTDVLEVVLAVSGPVTALVFAGASRLLRAEADDAVKDRLSQQLRGELATFKVDLLAGINGTYRRTAECQLIESGAAQRLDSIDARLQEVQTYAHERAHVMANDIQKLGAELRLRRDEG